MKSVRRTLLATVAVGLFVAGASSEVAAADDLERGRQVFALCAQCHGEAGAGNQLFLAPSIAGLNQWYVEAQLGHFRSGARGLHPDDIAGMRMAPMSRTLRSDEDLRAVAAYVASLPVTRPEPTLTGGNPDNGKNHFALCATCHGADGAGNQQMFAPPLRNSSDWYLLTQIEKFRSGVRGSNPGNPNGAVMWGMAMTLPDDQAIKDVIAYITTLAQ
jgi:cytochrome c oxidase subunit 2